MRSRKLVVKINQTKANLAGVTNRDIAISLRTYLTGFQTGEYREDDKVIPIVMRNANMEQIDIGRLESLNIYSQYSGKSVPLKQVADIKVEWEFSKIARRDQYRTVTVFCSIRSGFNAAEMTSVFSAWLEQEAQSWGTGYTYNLGGEAILTCYPGSIGEPIGVVYGPTFSDGRTTLTSGKLWQEWRI